MKLRPVKLAIPPLTRISEEIPDLTKILVRGSEAFLNRRGRNLIKADWWRGQVAWAVELPFPPRRPRGSPREYSLMVDGTAILSKLGLAICVFEVDATILVAAVDLTSGDVRWVRRFKLAEIFATPEPEVIAKARAAYAATPSGKRSGPLGDPIWNIHVNPLEVHDAVLLRAESALVYWDAFHPLTGAAGRDQVLLELDPLSGATMGRHDAPWESISGRAIVTASGVSVWSESPAKGIPRFERPTKSKLGVPLDRGDHAMVPIRMGKSWGVVKMPFDERAAPVVQSFAMTPSPRSVFDKIVPLGNDLMLFDGLRNIAFLNADGQMRWTAKTPPYVYSIAALADGPIAVGTAGAGGSLFVLDRATGRVLFRHPHETGSVAAVEERGGFIADGYPAYFVQRGPRGDWSVQQLSKNIERVIAVRGDRVLHGYESLRLADIAD